MLLLLFFFLFFVLRIGNKLIQHWLSFELRLCRRGAGGRRLNGVLFVALVVVVAAVATVTAAFAAVVAFFGTAFIVFTAAGVIVWEI